MLERQKKLRKIRRLLIGVTALHYGSIFIKESKFPYGEVIYEFVLKHVYNGIFSFVIRPVCEWLWNQDWYDMLYFLSGLPTFAVVILLTILIKMKEKGGTIVTEKTYMSFFRDFGTYRCPKPSVIFRIRNCIQKKFFSEAVNMAEESMNLVLLRVLWGQEEMCADLTHESECLISEEVTASYEKKEGVIYLKNRNQIFKSLRKGEYYEISDVVFQYL